MAHAIKYPKHTPKICPKIIRIKGYLCLEVWPSQKVWIQKPSLGLSKENDFF